MPHRRTCPPPHPHPSQWPRTDLYQNPGREREEERLKSAPSPTLQCPSWQNSGEHKGHPAAETMNALVGAMDCGKACSITELAVPPSGDFMPLQLPSSQKLRDQGPLSYSLLDRVRLPA